MRAVVILSIFLMLSVAPGVSAQIEPCDFNQNGFVDIGDFGALMGMIGGGEGIDSLPEYFFEWDCDRDKIHLTVSDPIGMMLRLIHGPYWGQGLQMDSFADTIYIPEVEAYPGEEIEIPISIYTSRYLRGFQLYIEYDANLISITDFIFSETIPDSPYDRLYLFDGGASIWVLLPPDYHLEEEFIGNLRVSILPDAPAQKVAALKFGSNPHRALYTGLASRDDFNDSPGLKLFFIHPVKSDGIIRIVDNDDLKSDGGS